MYITQYYDAIIQAYEALIDCLNQLCRHLYDELTHYPVWVMKEEAFVADRDFLIYALKKFDADTELSPQATWACPGAVACTQSTIELVDQVNQAKDHLKQQSQAYKKLFTNHQPSQTPRDILEANGYGHLKMKQVYRHIRYIPYQPDRIAWCQGKAYSNVRITQKQARQALIEVGKGDNIDVQLAKLSMLEPHDKLVKQRQIKPCWVANITNHQAPKDQKYAKIPTSLPLFYVFDNDRDYPPEVCLSQKSHRDKTSTRSDKRIEDEPFLPSISVYRYKHYLN